MEQKSWFDKIMEDNKQDYKQLPDWMKGKFKKGEETKREKMKLKIKNDLMNNDSYPILLRHLVEEIKKGTKSQKKNKEG